MPAPIPEPIDEPSDLDQNNPIDLDGDEWLDVYSEMDDFEDYLDRDMSMN